MACTSIFNRMKIRKEIVIRLVIFIALIFTVCYFCFPQSIVKHDEVLDILVKQCNGIYTVSITDQLDIQELTMFLAQSKAKPIIDAASSYDVNKAKYIITIVYDHIGPCDILLGEHDPSGDTLMNKAVFSYGIFPKLAYKVLSPEKIIQYLDNKL